MTLVPRNHKARNQYRYAVAVVGLADMAVYTEQNRRKRIYERIYGALHPCICSSLREAIPLSARIQDFGLRTGRRFYRRGGTLTMNVCEKPGADTGFFLKREFRPAIRKAGCVEGGGGAVRFRPDTISARGGGGGAACRIR